MRNKRAKRLRKKENLVNKTIDEAVKELSIENFKQARQAIAELADMYKTAGSTAQDFANLCKYIEDEAVKKSGDPLLSTKFGSFMRDLSNRQIIGSVH